MLTKELLLLNESGLRFRIRDQHAQVYFAADPLTVLGSQYLGRMDDTHDHHKAWDLIDRVLGHLMPADMVDEEYLELFDGVAYIGGGFAFVTCPSCGERIKGDVLQAQIDHDGSATACPSCGSQLSIVSSDRLSNR